MEDFKYFGDPKDRVKYELCPELSLYLRGLPSCAETQETTRRKPKKQHNGVVFILAVNSFVLPTGMLFFTGQM